MSNLQKYFYKVGNLLAVWSVFMISYGQAVGDQSEIDNPMRGAIRKVDSSASSITQGEFDSVGCGSFQSGKVLLRADFTGDGRLDFAALLKIGKVGSKLVQGQNWQMVNVWLVAFIRNAKGSYKSFVLEKMPEEYIPIGLSLELQKPGKVKDIESEKTIDLKNSSIMLHYCEKSDVVLYWKDGKFSTIAISD